jgi:glycosyltransferase involved in cell wall biosynthesis
LVRRGHDVTLEFLRDAAALLFPVRWPEPFGLIMLEALACGTPVLASNGGSVPEVIQGRCIQAGVIDAL